MKCRIIIDCDPYDVGGVVVKIPEHVHFVVTRLPTVPKVGNMGKMIMDEMKQLPSPLKKKAKPRGRHSGLVSSTIIMHDLLKSGPKTMQQIKEAFKAAGHISKNFYSRLNENLAKGNIRKTEAGLYELTRSQNDTKS